MILMQLLYGDLVYYSNTLENGEHTVLLKPVTINGKVSIASDGLFYLNNDCSGMFEIENPSLEVRNQIGYNDCKSYWWK